MAVAMLEGKRCVRTKTWCKHKAICKRRIAAGRYKNLRSCFRAKGWKKLRKGRKHKK